MKFKIPESLYAHLLSSMALFSSAQGLNVAVSILRNKVVAVVLGPWGMGIIALYNTVLHLLQLLTGLGLSTSGVRYVAETGDVKKLRSWSLLTAIAGTFLCLILSPWLSDWIFGDRNHVRAIACLASVVGLTTLACNEQALLRGKGELRAVAKQSVWGCILTAAVTIPVIFIWRERAIVPSIAIAALMSFCTVIWFSLKCVPLQGSISWSALRGGGDLLRLGMLFVVASVIAAGGDLLVRTLLNREGALTEVGLFHAAYMTVFSLGGMFFASLESDYYPQLSALNMQSEQATKLINNQIEVALLSISPFIVLGILSLDWIIPLLFSQKFLPATECMQLMLLALYLRALKLPLSYIPLAQNRGIHYVLLEGVYYIMFVFFVWLGYVHFGILGAGCGVLLTAVADYLLLAAYAFVADGYALPLRQWLMGMAQFSLGVATFFTSTKNLWIGLIFFAISVGLSLLIFTRRLRQQ